ncbi:MAG: hypothetical protein DMG23_11595 [Acidobacteria bacterium]|nr:MAG: hypothetical protein DMG23_11595 [Acidobacteriota bacterium]
MISRPKGGLVFFAASSLIPFCFSQHTVPPGARDFCPAGIGLASLVAPWEGPKAVFPEVRFVFGEVRSGVVVEHDFVVKNAGSASLVIQKVSMTTPLVVTRMPREVAPGAEDRIHFKLDTTNLAGKFEGAILVFLNEPELPQAELSFAGSVFANRKSRAPERAVYDRTRNTGTRTALPFDSGFEAKRPRRESRRHHRGQNVEPENACAQSGRQHVFI